MELRKRAFGLAMGIVFGLGMMLGTWWLLIWGSEGGIMSRANTLFIGYSYSWGGAIMGFIWGFIAGVLIAWFYDVFYKMIYKTKQ